MTEDISSLPPEAPPPGPRPPAPTRNSSGHPAASEASPTRAFWSYSDLFLLIGLAIPSMILGWGIVRAVYTVFRIHSSLRVMELLPQQFLGYMILFGALALLLRMEYDRPFWRSLGWTPMRIPFLWIVICGLATFLGVNLVGLVIRTPTTSNPLTELLADRVSIILMGIFGVTIAPLSEELLFRGFLQPLLVRSLGAAPGIFLAAVSFGLLHYHEYGNSWRHAVLISLAGVCFGAMRHVTGSTKASTIMHAAYNAYIFAVVYMGKGAPSP